MRYEQKSVTNYFETIVIGRPTIWVGEHHSKLSAVFKDWRCARRKQSRLFPVKMGGLESHVTHTS